MRPRCWLQRKPLDERNRGLVFSTPLEVFKHFLGTLEDFLCILALNRIGLLIRMVTPAEGAAYFNNQPKRRIGRQIDSRVLAAIRWGFLELLQLCLRIRKALTQHCDFLRRNRQIAAHFLGRRAAAWQLGQDIRKIVLNPTRNQLSPRAGPAFGFNKQLGKQDAIPLMLRRMFGELIQGPFPERPVIGHRYPDSLSKDA